MITLEPSPDTDPGPSMEIVLAGGLLEGVVEQVRALHVPGDDDGSPSAVGLIEQVGLASASARQAQAAATNGDLEMAQTRTACVMAIIQGSEDCGDGVGIVTYADNVAAAAAAAQEAAEGSDPQDEPAAGFSKATAAAAALVRERAEQARAAAALASAATSTQVADSPPCERSGTFGRQWRHGLCQYRLHQFPRYGQLYPRLAKRWRGVTTPDGPLRAYRKHHTDAVGFGDVLRHSASLKRLGCLAPPTDYRTQKRGPSLRGWAPLVSPVTVSHLPDWVYVQTG